MTNKIVSGFKSVVGPVANLKKHSTAFRRVIDYLPKWVTPNRVTSLRFLMVIPLLSLILTQLYWQALICFGFAMLLDAIDGALAEIRGLHSELGAFIDPLADKVIVCSALIALLGQLPSAFVWTTAATCMFALGLTLTRVVLMIRDRDKEIPANEAGVMAKLVGKAKCLVEVLGIIVVLIGLATATSSLIWIALGVLCLAAILGFFSFWSQFRQLLPNRR
jgi:phosphatidylglycerophosphate synthase